MKTTNVGNNPGPASVIVIQGAKELDIACSVIMGEEDVLKNPLQITDAKVHTCELDEEKGIAKRRYDGTYHKANIDTLRAARDQRIRQGRAIEGIPEMPEITGNFEGEISATGEIIRPAMDSER